MGTTPAPRVVDLRVHPDVWLDGERLRLEACRAAGLRPAEAGPVRVVRKTVDARKGRVRLQLRLEIAAPGAPAEATSIQPVVLPTLRGEPKVAVVGAGPAGLFCAWALARQGIRSIVLERGKPVRQRRRSLAALSRHGQLDPESNYCFGEGGAGTFSDGKLYTRSHKRGEIRDVLEAFVGYGASPEILVDARPHIGTNKLPGVITRMREHLLDAGVLFAFDSRVDGLLVRDRTTVGVQLADGQSIETAAVVVAPGHSARDVHRFVARAGAAVELKPFALGVRIEHPQSFIDRLQYGDLAGHPALGAAAYRLVEHAGPVSVFSFCMCPGGFICPAATEPQAQVVNGWSPSSRRGLFANSGFVTQVGPEQLADAGLDPDDPFAGMAFQRTVEQAAYQAGGGDFVAPAQRLDDFLAGRASQELPACSYPRGVEPARLDRVLGALSTPLRVALRQLDRRMPGFVGPDAIAVGVESRTSSPVRMLRDPQTLQSPTLSGLHPCGEGAGFAGGIVSAALDGIRVAAAIAGQHGFG